MAWEFQANGLTVDDARSDRSTANGINAGDAKIQTLVGSSGERLRVQVGDQPHRRADRGHATAFAKAAGVERRGRQRQRRSARRGASRSPRRRITRPRRVLHRSSRSTSRSASSGRWPSPRSLAVFHDVLISVGVYSIFGFEVTPATVIAFLTILGFSLYDTIVVFDKVHENTQQLGHAAGVLRRHRQPVDEPGADALAQHQPRRRPAGALAAGRRRRGCWARSRSRTSRSPCSSACSPARTRRSSSPRRSWPAQGARAERTRSAGRQRAADADARGARPRPSTSAALEPAAGAGDRRASVAGDPAGRPAAPATPTAGQARRAHPRRPGPARRRRR